MYVPHRFDKEELFPRAIIQKRGEAVWELMDNRLLITLDCLSDDFGPMWCNNWAIGGKLDSCGWRPGDDPDGAILSQHRYGRAADPKPVTNNIDGYERYLQANPKRFKNPSRVQKIINWAREKKLSTVVAMIREWILANPAEYPYIMAIEIRAEWMHIDTRNCDRIMRII
jgi:hypothetical protein